MKLPKSQREARREVERVVQKILKLVEGNESIGKNEFERILGAIIEQVHKNRGIDLEQIAQVNSKVILSIKTEYGKLSEDLKGWDALITFLYIKYHHELGIASDTFKL